MAGFNEEGSFARRLLESQGWTEGSGLGKNGQGISEPVRPSLKFDTTGVGHDPGKEFTDHWWARAYDEAARELEVKPGEDGSVEVKKKRKKGKKEKEKKKAQLYAGFVKTATLDEGVLKPETSKDSSEKKKVKADPLRILSDEELFAACDGMTAHKGGRHGHSMSAKYKRLAELDKELLKKMQKKKKKT
eukprot:TRINITY_DN5821_c0_g1_i1.p1 TRINITY_DN5821_c0_g1~~TRINITY_DN5821_c0_g1_i1.p1  ORF type:complete len:189 (+),score=60.43 TRINITY_DN5821_c0_g1_i1:55-621(+)